MSILNLKRNDVESALAVYRAGCTPEEAKGLLLLQDDPEPLARAMSMVDEQRKDHR